MASRKIPAAGRQRSSQQRKVGQGRFAQGRVAGPARQAIQRGVGAQGHRNLEDRTVLELRTRARELGIVGRSRMRRAQLLRAIRSQGH